MYVVKQRFNLQHHCSSPSRKKPSNNLIKVHLKIISALHANFFKCHLFSLSFTFQEEECLKLSEKFTYCATQYATIASGKKKTILRQFTSNFMVILVSERQSKSFQKNLSNPVGYNALSLEPVFCIWVLLSLIFHFSEDKYV